MEGDRKAKAFGARRWYSLHGTKFRSTSINAESPGSYQSTEK
jgi:hypothetical protein